MTKPNVNPALREALRSLLLPVSPELEGSALVSAEAEIRQHRINQDDVVDWLRHEGTRWIADRRPSRELARVLQAALRAGDPDFGDRLANAYIRLHADIQESRGLTHDQASLVLSNAGLILRLASRERMSATQIARVLAARHP